MHDLNREQRLLWKETARQRRALSCQPWVAQAAGEQMRSVCHFWATMPRGSGVCEAEIKQPTRPRRKPFWSGLRGRSVWDREEKRMGGRGEEGRKEKARTEERK